MTSRDFYSAIISADVSPEITAYATDALDVLNKRNAAAKEKRDVKRDSEMSVFRSLILPKFKDVAAMTCAEVRELKGMGEYTAPKISSILTRLVNAGELEVRLTDRTGRPCKEYFIPQN